MKLNGVNVMIKIIVLVVLIGFQIYSIYSIGIKNDEIKFQYEQIETLKEEQLQLIKTYEEELKERELKVNNRKETVNTITKAVKDEKCFKINDTIDKRIIDRLHKHENSK